MAGQTFATDRFDLDAQLPVHMLAVVGGIGSVGGALFGGLLLGVFPVMQHVFAANAIGIFRIVRIPVTEPDQFLPGLIGVSLGRKPDGAAPQVAAGFAPCVGTGRWHRAPWRRRPSGASPTATSSTAGRSSPAIAVFCSPCCPSCRSLVGRPVAASRSTLLVLAVLVVPSRSPGRAVGVDHRLERRTGSWRCSLSTACRSVVGRPAERRRPRVARHGRDRATAQPRRLDGSPRRSTGADADGRGRVPARADPRGGRLVALLEPAACPSASAATWPSTTSTSRSKPAQVTGLIGPNGAGKTTTVQR